MNLSLLQRVLARLVRLLTRDSSGVGIDTGIQAQVLVQTRRTWGSILLVCFTAWSVRRLMNDAFIEVDVFRAGEIGLGRGQGRGIESRLGGCRGGESQGLVKGAGQIDGTWRSAVLAGTALWSVRRACKSGSAVRDGSRGAVKRFVSRSCMQERRRIGESETVRVCRRVDGHCDGQATTTVRIPIPSVCSRVDIFFLPFFLT